MRSLSLVLFLALATTSAAASTAHERLKETVLRFDIGSGSIVEGKSGKTYMLTNYHVCAHSTQDFEVLGGRMHGLLENGESYLGKIVKYHASYDLCAIQVELPKNAKPLKLAPNMSDNLYTRGYPRGVIGTFKGNVVSVDSSWVSLYLPSRHACAANELPLVTGDRGFVGCLVRYNNTLTNLFSKPGSSGSPVVNPAGEIVGIIQSGSQQRDTLLTGIVPYNELKDFLSTL